MERAEEADASLRPTKEAAERILIDLFGSPETSSRDPLSGSNPRPERGPAEPTLMNSRLVVHLTLPGLQCSTMSRNTPIG